MAQVHPQRLEYTNIYRTTDNILENWRSRQLYVLTRLLTNPLDFAYNLWIDPHMISTNSECMCQAGTSTSPALLSKDFRCNECVLLSRLIDLLPDTVNFENSGCSNVQTFESGKVVDKCMVLQRVKVLSPRITIVLRSPDHQQYVTDVVTPQPSEERGGSSEGREGPSVAEKGSPERGRATGGEGNTVYMGMDHVSNNIIVNWILSDIFLQCGLKNIRNLYTAYGCGNQIFHIYECSKIGSIENLIKYQDLIDPSLSRPITASDPTTLSSSTVYNIIVQLLTTLKILSNYAFIHGSPNVRSLEFFDDMCNYTYNDVVVNSPITVKMKNFHNSGVTLARRADRDVTEGDIYIERNDSVRVFSRSMMAEEHLEIPRLDNSIINEAVRYPTTPDIEYYHDYYRYRNYAAFLRFYRHAGLPLVSHSYDIISFLVSLLSYGPFYYGFANHPLLVEIWRGLWTEHDLDDIDMKIREIHDQDKYLASSQDICKLLAYKWIPLHALDIIWEKIRTL